MIKQDKKQEEEYLTKDFINDLASLKIWTVIYRNLNNHIIRTVTYFIV